MDISLILDEIKLASLGLECGETLPNTTCPFCKGGDSGEASLSITRINSGLLYNCFRATCHRKGFIASRSHTGSQRAPEWKPREFLQTTETIPNNIYRWIAIKYGIHRELLERNGVKYARRSHRLVFPIYNVDEKEVGVATKKLPAHLSDLADNDIPDGPKWNFYWTKQDVKLHFPVDTDGASNTVIVVEDQLSAMKLSQIHPTVCLLGTSLSPDAAVVLAKCYDNMVLMLDPDAKNIAIAIANKYSSVFKRCDVVNAIGDPKDIGIVHLRGIVSRRVYAA